MAMLASDAAPLPIKEDGETAAPKNRGGRPKGYSPPPRTPQNVTQALAVMDNFYSFLAMGMGLVEDDLTVSAFRAKVATLQVSNKGFFEADPKLAARVAKLGSTGGAGAFFIANAAVVLPFAIPAAMKIGPLVQAFTAALTVRFFGDSSDATES